MAMLHLASLEALEALQRDVPRLVSLLSASEPTFSQQTGAWLLSLEEELVRQGHALSGQVAALRGALILAERGELPVELPADPARASRRQVRDRVAMWAIREAERALTSALSADSARLAQAYELAVELCGRAIASGLRPTRLNGESQEAILVAFWSGMLSVSEIHEGCVALLSRAGPRDTLTLVERALSRS